MSLKCLTIGRVNVYVYEVKVILDMIGGGTFSYLFKLIEFVPNNLCIVTKQAQVKNK